MKLKLMVASIGMGALLLTGCGGGGAGDSYNMLLGTWDHYESDGFGGVCANYEDFNASEVNNLTFKDDVAISQFKYYNGLDCQEENLRHDSEETYEYRIGSQTEGSEGEEAYEIDVWLLSSMEDGEEETLTEEDKKTAYFMFKIEDGKLSFTDDDDTSEDNRANVFFSGEYYKKR